MILKRFACLIAAFVIFSAAAAAAQTPGDSAGQSLSPLPKISADLVAKLHSLGTAPAPSPENRELAYGKLFEAQKYIFKFTNLVRGRTTNAAESAVRARDELIAAIALNPRLAEAYTALAEIYISIPPADVDEGLALAGLALRIDRDNFGAQRITARLMTYRSGIGRSEVDKDAVVRATAAWTEVARLDPRNAEAWAFLSEFYERSGRADDQIAALRNWLAAPPPVEDQFYRRTMGRGQTLSPQTAALKLGPALLKAGKIVEGVDVLAQVAANDPEDESSIDLLRGAVESLRGDEALAALKSLGRAAYANPDNIALTGLLAQAQSRAGETAAAAALLSTAAEKFRGKAPESAARLYVLLGDVYAGADRPDEAAAAYDKALAARGPGAAATEASDDREFVMQVLEKIIRTFKAANRESEVRAAIERSRRIFGPDDQFADRQLVTFYRGTGKRKEALDVVATMRRRFPSDYGLMRLEATLLTEVGRVDEAVALVSRSMNEKPAAGAISENVLTGDQFSNLLFISNLYTQANRGREASDAANQAYLLAKSSERKQIARLTLASAQQMSGDYKSAERTLRSILAESPGNPIALNNLGYFLLERSDRVEEALTLIEQAYRIDPTNPSYLDSIGWAYFRLGKLDEAERYLKDAARIDAGSSTIQEHLGDTYQKKGRLVLAKAAWTRALQLASDQAEVLRLKAKLAGK